MASSPVQTVKRYGLRTSPEQRLWLSVLLAQISAAQGWGLGVAPKSRRAIVQAEAKKWLKSRDARLVAGYAEVSLTRLQRFARRTERQGWGGQKPRMAA